MSINSINEEVYKTLKNKPILFSHKQYCWVSFYVLSILFGIVGDSEDLTQSLPSKSLHVYIKLIKQGKERWNKVVTVTLILCVVGLSKRTNRKSGVVRELAMMKERLELLPLNVGRSWLWRIKKGLGRGFTKGMTGISKAHTVPNMVNKKRLLRVLVWMEKGHMLGNERILDWKGRVELYIIQTGLKPYVISDEGPLRFL